MVRLVGRQRRARGRGGMKREGRRRSGSLRSGSRNSSSSCVCHLLPQPPNPHSQDVDHQILGACILLSWNTEIVAGAYFGARLVGSPFQTSFASFVALTFTTGNLAFLAHANATQGGVHLPSNRKSKHG